MPPFFKLFNQIHYKVMKSINIVDLQKQCHKGMCNCKHGCQLDEIIITETILLLEYKKNKKLKQKP